MREQTALQTVQSFQASLGNGTEDWTKLIAEDINFNGPAAEVKGKADFIELNKGFSPRVKAYEPINQFEQNNLVCLEGKFKICTPKGNEINLTMAEVYTVENGLIQSVRVYYDAEEFRKEFA